MIVLPKGDREPEIVEPKLMLILSSTKTGKTSNCMNLPNHLLIDLEDRAKFFKGNPLGFHKIAKSLKQDKDVVLEKVIEQIRQDNIKAKKPVYDFIIVDTITALEEIAKQKALKNFRSSIIGKSQNYAKVQDICNELPKGSGYAHLATAFKYYLNLFDGLAEKCVILLGHKKVNIKEENGVEVEVTDLDLLGQNKKFVFQHSDCIGHLYRTKKKPNTNILSFKKGDYDTVWGSRPKHLRDKQFIFSVYDEKNDTLNVRWDLVFPSLVNSSSVTIEDVEDEYLELINKQESIKPTIDIPDDDVDIDEDELFTDEDDFE